MKKHTRTGFLISLTVLLFTFASFAACNKAPATNVTPSTTPNPCLPLAAATLEAILAHFASRNKLNFKGDTFAAQFSRHKGYFVWRRSYCIGRDHSGWDQAKIIQRLENEFDAVDAYLKLKLGTQAAPGPFSGGADPVSPPHLDLQDVARRYHSDRAGSKAVARRAHSSLEKRYAWTVAIVWRAAAIYDGVWQPFTDVSPAQLKTGQLDEILDRRLRLVERMTHNVSDAGPLGGRIFPKSFPGPNGPWKDGFRVRMFEYARVPKNKLFTDAIGSANIEFDRSKPDFEPGKIWRLGELGTRYEYNVAQPDRTGNRRGGLYLPPSQEDHWLSPDSDGYDQYLSPDGISSAAVIDDMFTPNPPDKWEDWWGRTWMWCDHVIAALHLEALLLGIRRRKQDDADFNNILLAKPNYIFIGPVVGLGGPIDENKLMEDDADPYFENIAVNVNDLQVGDHLIFWNSFIYRLISTGDWRLENALVMGIDSDPKGGVRVSGRPPSLQLSLQGHGTGSIPYGAYTGVIANKLRGAMAHLQGEIRAKVSADPTILTDPGKRKIEYSERKNTRIVYWSPYEDFASPGAWWIQIPRSVYFSQWSFATVMATVTAVKKAVGHEIATGKHIIHDGTTAIAIDSGPGYNPPPDTDAVYFPIFVPRVSAASASNTLDEGWYAYLRKRSADGTYRPRSNKLDKMTIDGTIMPGMFYRGVSQPIPIVRPKVN